LYVVSILSLLKILSRDFLLVGFLTFIVTVKVEFKSGFAFEILDDSHDATGAQTPVPKASPTLCRQTGQPIPHCFGSVHVSPHAFGGGVGVGVDVGVGGGPELQEGGLQLLLPPPDTVTQELPEQVR
jgi:hypothetical protein